jgi:uncharacterized protein (DUF1015 family)
MQPDYSPAVTPLERTVLLPVLSFRRPRMSHPTFEERHLDTVVPFRAWRYSAQAGDLADLVAPPYDIIGPELQSRLYARSLNNVVRVDLGMTTPSDNDCDNRYTRAAALLDRWKESGVLVRDSQPTLTFVEEEFTGPDGTEGHRHGFLAALRLSRFGDGVVFPHEQTLCGPKEDRFRLMTATAMNLSPVFLLYDLPGDDITSAWKDTLGGQRPTSTVVDDTGTVTKLWPTSDPLLLSLVAERLQGCRFLVADGHHRYETALRYQEAAGEAPGSKPRLRQALDFCLVYLANMGDPSLTIYPTHRLLGGVSEREVSDLPDALRSTFELERLHGPNPGTQGSMPGPGAAFAREAIAAYLRNNPRWAFGMWGPLLDAPYGLRLLDSSLAKVEPRHTQAYRELDVTILQSLVFDQILGISAADTAAEGRVAFFKDGAAAFASLERGELQVGFFLNPVGLDQVRAVAFAGERMPQKTTFFHPKLPTGLVFHDLTGNL